MGWRLEEMPAGLSLNAAVQVHVEVRYRGGMYVDLSHTNQHVEVSRLIFICINAVRGANTLCSGH